MMSLNIRQLFPTKWSLFIFLAYMILFVNQGILVKSSQTPTHSYGFNVVSVVLGIEFVKLFLSVTFYLRENKSLGQLFTDFRNGARICFLYTIPSILYCLYNNLAFVNLANYDPTSYYILMQFRNVITGIIYQLLFRKKLTLLQWISLVILTIGCIVKEFGRGNDAKNAYSIFNVHLLLIVIQIICSCFAGVYNELLLKDIGSSVCIWMQNIYMYTDSIICNLVLLCFNTTSHSELSFAIFMQPMIILILLNGALAGISTSFFLKCHNSIVKTFATTLEIIITAILCYFIFGTTIDQYTILSMILIFIAIFIYSHKPIPTVSVDNQDENCSQDLDI
ncbi:hypothetical protein BLOT_004345 [Blomia tropicalis]|nr:hypothetical protein BLOT_004345 [Blomia tropicalis]